MGIDNPVHILFLAAVALVVLGPKRLPELTRAAGKSIREFREALNDGVVEEPPTMQPPPQVQPPMTQPQAAQLTEQSPMTQPQAAQLTELEREPE
jgi:sec-independent protein translocase protein TatA